MRWLVSRFAGADDAAWVPPGDGETAVLRLVADGRLALDDPANRHLRTVRLGDDTITVRELLTHTGGVASPDAMFSDTVPDLVTLVGPMMACPGPRGTFSYSNGGYGMLGQLIADITGTSYQDTARDLVLRPLDMTESFFPGRWPERDAVTGYQLAEDGSFEPAPAQMCTLPAAGGLWASGPDLARFAVTWDSLLPAELAREALRPQAGRAPGRRSSSTPAAAAPAWPWPTGSSPSNR